MGFKNPKIKSKSCTGATGRRNMNLVYGNAGRMMSDTERNSIENSIGTISSTPYAAAPFLRSMGIKNYPPENNSEIARSLYAAEVITQTGIWEDRVKVEQVTFDENNEARMVLKNG